MKCLFFRHSTFNTNLYAVENPGRDRDEASVSFISCLHRLDYTSINRDGILKMETDENDG